MRTLAWVLIVLLGFGLVLALVFPVFLAPVSRHMYGYGGMMGPGMMGGYGLFGPLLAVLFVALLVGAVAWLLLSAGKAQGKAAPPPGDTPVEIIKRRYASGEITKKQFEEMKRDLGA